MSYVVRHMIALKKADVHISCLIADKKDRSRKNSKCQDNSIEVDENMKIQKMCKKHINVFMCNVFDKEFLSVEKIQGHFNSFH